MKQLRLFLLVLLPLALTACGLSSQQKADYDSVQRSGVSSAIYDKMVHGDPLSLGDIKSLARSGVNDAVILRYIRDRGTVYTLSSEDVTSLRKAGVSQSVVDYMLQTARNVGPYGPDGYPYGPYWGDPFWGPYWGPYWGGGYYYGGGGYYHHHWH